MKYCCYFGEGCLHITEESDFLSTSPLKSFRIEIPFRYEIELFLFNGDFPDVKNINLLSEAGGINIFEIDNHSWLFQSRDEHNPCCIEANQDYSILNGYINLNQSSDKNIVQSNFLQLLRVSIECKSILSDGLSIHASCISKNQEAVLFTAPSGTGKSTQASIWEKHLGAKIVNGDRPMLRISNGEIRAYGVPWDGKEQLFLQENYPVKTVIEVRQAKQNSLRKLKIDQAYKLLAKQCFIPMWDDTAKFLTITTIKNIVNSIPFYRLYCLPNEEAADLVDAVLFNGQIYNLKEEQEDMKIKEGFILRNVVDEWIVMPTGSNLKNFEGALVLNDISAFIWKQLENPMSRDDLLNAILAEYDVDEQEAGKDLDEFLDKLAKSNLLQEK